MCGDLAIDLSVTKNSVSSFLMRQESLIFLVVIYVNLKYMYSITSISSEICINVYKKMYKGAKCTI